MKNSTLIKSLFAASFVFAASQFTLADEVNRKVIYKGDESARAICTAIASDHVNKLNRSLHSLKYSKLDDKVHTRYTCNGEDLLTFAEQMSAENATEYLAKKFDK